MVTPLGACGARTIQNEVFVMDLAIIVVNYNSTGDLMKCLASIQRFLVGVTYECCVVDNASTRGDLDSFAQSFPSVKLIRNSINVGFAKAVNQGIAATSAPLIVWMNPDAELQNEGIKTLSQYFDKHPNVGIIGPKIIDPDGGIQYSGRSFPSYQTSLFNRYSLLTRLFPWNPWSQRYLGTSLDRSQPQPVDWVSGACLFHRRRVAEQLGGLDEHFFMYCEDTDFCLRAKKSGWHTIYHPGATVMHRIGGSSSSLPLKMLLTHHQSMWHYYKKNFKRNPFKDVLVFLSIAVRFLVKLIFYFLK